VDAYEIQSATVVGDFVFAVVALHWDQDRTQSRHFNTAKGGACLC
jgi:hypothetical protein